MDFNYDMQTVLGYPYTKGQLMDLCVKHKGKCSDCEADLGNEWGGPKTAKTELHFQAYDESGLGGGISEYYGKKKAVSIKASKELVDKYRGAQDEDIDTIISLKEA